MVTQLNPARSEILEVQAAISNHKPKWQERLEQRQENKRKAEEASWRRSQRGRYTMESQVEVIRKRLEGANVVNAVALIREASDRDRDLWLLVEEYGANRKGVLRHFNPPRNTVREAFISAGLASPNESTGDGGEE